MTVILPVCKRTTRLTHLLSKAPPLPSAMTPPLPLFPLPPPSGGNPVLGYLLGGILVGPHALGIIQDVESIKHLAELGVVFLLFNIGLELSMERLASLAKYVFGMGTLQVRGGGGVSA